MTTIKDAQFIAFDVETTGLFSLSGAIVEIAGVRFNGDGQVIDQFDELVDPEMEISQKAIDVHGITQKDVKGKPKIREVLPRFLDFLGDAERLLLAHNATFDIGFVSAALVKSNLDLPKHVVLDSLPISRELCPRARAYNLEALARDFGIADREVHRALPDSVMLKDVFLALLEHANRVTIVEDLFELSETLDFATAGVYRLDPPAGFEEMGKAMEDQQPIIMVYDGGTLGLEPRSVTPVTIFEQKGKAFLKAHCNTDQTFKTYRLDRIREFNLESDH